MVFAALYFAKKTKLNLAVPILAMIAFNALDAGPKWIPAQQDGKKVKSFRIQPVTLTNPDR